MDCGRVESLLTEKEDVISAEREVRNGWDEAHMQKRMLDPETT